MAYIGEDSRGLEMASMPLGKMNASREIRLHETADKILSARIQTVHQLVSSLEDRLDPVCRHQPESAAGARPATPPAVASNTPLADVFNRLEQQLSMLLERLDRLLSRIEL